MNKTIVEDWSFEIEVLSAEPVGSGWKRATPLPAPTVVRTAFAPKPWELSTPCAKRPAQAGIIGCSAAYPETRSNLSARTAR